MGVPPEQRTERRWQTLAEAGGRLRVPSDQTFRPHAVPQKHQGVVPREVPWALGGHVTRWGGAGSPAVRVRV